jgi:hypothetical protein
MKPSHIAPYYQCQFLPEVEAVLRESGWSPGRKVSEEQINEWLVIEWPVKHGVLQIRMFPAAWRALNEFGGLHIEQDAPGISLSRHSFIIDPLAVRDAGRWEYNWIFDEWAVNGALFPLGVWNEGECDLAIDGQGRVVTDNLQLVGNSIEEALTALILGIMPEEYPDEPLEGAYPMSYQPTRAQNPISERDCHGSGNRWISVVTPQGMFAERFL